MIKLLTELSDNKLKSVLSIKLDVYEKLDMPYFKVKITPYGIFALKPPKFTAISDIDCICNDMYKQCCAFVKTVIEPIKDKIISHVGIAELGFFYLPVKQSKHINYYTMDDGTFIFSDIYTENKDSKISSLDFYEFLKSIIENIDEYICPPPIIKKLGLTNDKIEEICANISSWNNEKIVSEILGDYTTYSELPVKDIEGIILRSNTKQWQIIVNPTNPAIDKTTKKIYRDLVMHTLAAFIDDSLITELSQSKDSYKDKVARLFIDFITDTDLFSKYSFDSEDFIPPHEGYFGELDIDAFDDETVYTICKYNDVHKNLLRMLLYTFTNPISLKKFSDLSIEDVDKLNKLTQVLKFKNFAEIALLHTSAH